ncbi:MAG: thiol-disulfide oxidoreductase DCC family protein [Bacteroidetes bacterium]|nr:thiol-disulfide oxidoreductase DCC family protein [Bacteroidota bacterium]
MYVVLFDGVCNLCNGAVNWLIDHDPKNVLKFASLQSNYGQQIVAKHKLQGEYLNTILLVEDDKVYERSTAVLRALKHIGGWPALLYVFIVVPVFIRNAVYNFVARNRYKWFGKMDACRIPTPELKAKFLD